MSLQKRRCTSTDTEPFAMLTQRDFALSIDGAAIIAEIDRLGQKGTDGIEMARRLSRRINCTVDWQPLGPDGARYRHIIDLIVWPMPE